MLITTILLQAECSSPLRHLLPPVGSPLFLFHLFSISRDRDVSRNPGQKQQIYHHANDSELHAE